MPFQVSTHVSLLSRLQSSGDDEVWQEFHDRYYALVRGFARRRGLQPIDADDVAQEVLMAVHRGIREFHYDPAKGRFRGFLKTLALRAIWRRTPMDDEHDEGMLDRLAADGEIEEMWEAEWRQYHLRLAMSRIRFEFPAAEVRVFEMLTSEDRPSKEVASESGLPIDRVYRVKSAILARLRDLIAAQVNEEG